MFDHTLFETRPAGVGKCSNENYLLDFITAGVPETNDKHALNFFRLAI
jgi:hypothetical protein